MKKKLTNSNIANYYDNLKLLFSIWIYFEM